MPLRLSHLAAAAAAVSALTCATVLLRAGPLNPPAGPVAPTYKTLTEVEPRIPIGPATTPGTGTALYRIAAPGSYYLTANVTGVSGKNGIEVTASGVSLDLRGHTLTGVPGSLDGVFLSLTTADRITVTGGTIASWGGDGVDLTSSGRGCILREIQSMNNAGAGFRASSGAVLTACTAHANTGGGFATGESCALEACTAQNNGSTGFSVPSSTFTACAAHGNAGIGFNGGGTLANCISAFNTSYGFVGNGTYTGCKFSDSNGPHLCNSTKITSSGAGKLTAAGNAVLLSNDTVLSVNPVPAGSGSATVDAGQTKLTAS